MFERFTRHARVAVGFAQEEAREVRTREITPLQLLLGILQAAATTCPPC